MLPSLGMTELIVIMVIALIIFGPRKLPELGRSLGKSLGEFRKASNELKSTLEEEIRVEERREQRAKLDAEQTTAVEAASSHTTAADWMPPADPEETPPSGDAVDTPVEAPTTVSRTNTGTPA
jgi:TatA/E family protein of Tat protein translocase